MANPGIVTNPNGNGGFKEHPENQSNGRWRKEDSQSYCLNMFLKMTEEEFLKWASENPPAERTIAQTLAYNRIIKAKTDLKNWSAVTNRTEGMPKQKIDLEGGIDVNLPELIKRIDIIVDDQTAENSSDQGIDQGNIQEL